MRPLPLPRALGLLLGGLLLLAGTLAQGPNDTCDLRRGRCLRSLACVFEWSTRACSPVPAGGPACAAVQTAAQNPRGRGGKRKKRQRVPVRYRRLARAQKACDDLPGCQWRDALPGEPGLCAPVESQGPTGSTPRGSQWYEAVGLVSASKASSLQNTTGEDGVAVAPPPPSNTTGEDGVAVAPPPPSNTTGGDPGPISAPTPPQSCETCSSGCNPACTGGGLALGEDPCVCSGLLALFGDKAATTCGYNPQPGSPPVSYCGLSSDGTTVDTEPGSAVASRCATECDFNGALTGVTFTGQGLAAFPAEAASLLGTSVQVLDLSNNALTGLPNDFGGLSGLTRLILEGNQVGDLGGLAQALGALSGLASLNLARNQIQSIPGTSIPKKSWRLLPVQELDLSAQNPKLRTINPKFLKHLSQVTTLMIQDNALASLPPQVSLLTGLAVLDASGQEGGNLKLPPKAFRCNNKLTGLGTCDVSNNPNMNCKTISAENTCCTSCLTNGGAACAAKSIACKVGGGGGGGGGGGRSGTGDSQGALESV